MAHLKLTFPQWLSLVDEVLKEHIGLSVSDLPAHDYEAHYAADESPEEVVFAGLRSELETLGFQLSIADLFNDAAEKGTEQFVAADGFLIVEPDPETFEADEDSGEDDDAAAQWLARNAKR